MLQNVDDYRHTGLRFCGSDGGRCFAGGCRRLRETFRLLFGAAVSEEGNVSSL